MAARPLTPGERSKIVSIVRDSDETLADRLASELELDPTTRLLLSQLQDIQQEVRAVRWWTVAVVLVAMALNAGLVGVSMSFSSNGDLEVNGVDSVGALGESRFDDEDGTAELGHTAAPSPAPPTSKDESLLP